MAYAIVRAAGKQHRVEAGTRLVLNRIAHDVGAEFTFGDVLLHHAGDAVHIGQPVVAGATVTAKVLAHGRGKKIRVFKRRKRKGFHKTIGHRQELTAIEVIAIGS